MKRNLILIHRGPEYERDFEEIAAKVIALDNSITVYHLPGNLTAELPARAWQYPTLTVALMATSRLPINRGPVLRNIAIEKLIQRDVFKKNGIPTPPALSFQFGMTLDPILFGEFVVLKPMDLGQTSKGDGVYLMRRRRLHEKKMSDFPPDHPIQTARTGYIVQRFIDTGEYPSNFRVQTFLGKAIYAWNTNLLTARADLQSSDDEIERSRIANQGTGLKTRTLVFDTDVIELAERVHSAFPTIPMLGVDILRDKQSGKLWVLECNAGGNTWHFSSRTGERIRLLLGNSDLNGPVRANEIARRMLVEQFGAFDIVANRLVESVRQLAS